MRLSVHRRECCCSSLDASLVRVPLKDSRSQRILTFISVYAVELIGLDLLVVTNLL